MKLPSKIILAAILFAVVPVVGAAVLMTGDGRPPSERVARAAANTESYFLNEVESFRYRSTSVQQVLSYDFRPPGPDTEKRIHYQILDVVDAEFRGPDRARMSWDSYRVYPDEPSNRYLIGECESDSISIGRASYSQQCDGTWAQGDDLDEATRLRSDRTGEFARLKDLSTVRQAASETLRGVEVDVYQGTYIDGEAERDVIVKIGREHGLVRYFRATTPEGFLWEIERWDFNSPDIVIEPPAL